MLMLTQVLLMLTRVLLPLPQLLIHLLQFPLPLGKLLNILREAVGAWAGHAAVPTAQTRILFLQATEAPAQEGTPLYSAADVLLCSR